MTQKTMLARHVQAVDSCIALDEACKKVIANKVILAWIMKTTLKEYRDFDVGFIAESLIEGEPVVSKIAVHRDEKGDRQYMGKYIHGEDTVDKSMNEGTVFFDIRFRAILPCSGECTVLIINVEAQNDFYPGYPLIKRGIYYCCRMISSQYGVEFETGHYEKLKKVYSVWICINPPKHRQHSITKYEIVESKVIGDSGEMEENYDLISAVMICLGKLGEVESARKSEITELLSILFSANLGVEEKLNRLEKDFGIIMTEGWKEMENMCNYSQFVEQRGVEKGIKQGIEQGKFYVLVSLVNDGLLNLSEAARRADVSEAEFCRRME